MRFALVPILGAAVLVIVGADRIAAGDKAPMPVKLTAKAGAIDKDGRQVVTVTMEVEKGWHAYANPVNCDMLAGCETVVNIAAAKKLEEVKVAYPAGTKKNDVLEGKPFAYMVYLGKTEFTASVLRAAGDTGPLDGSVKYNVCNDKGLCLPPAQVQLQVK